MNPLRRRIQTAMQSGGGGGTAFSPTDIAGLQLWLQASRINGLNNGDPVATWADLSGNANDATQGTASQRPTWNSAGYVTGDGVDDTLLTPAINAFPSKRGAVAVIYRRPSGTSYRNVIGMGTLPNRWWAYASLSGTAYRWFDGTDYTDTVDGTGWQYRIFNRTGDTTLRSLLNGSLQSTFTVSNLQQSTGPIGLFDAPGVGSYLNGDIAVVLNYSVALSVAEEATLNAWLASQVPP